MIHRLLTRLVLPLAALSAAAIGSSQVVTVQNETSIKITSPQAVWQGLPVGPQGPSPWLKVAMTATGAKLAHELQTGPVLFKVPGNGLLSESNSQVLANGTDIAATLLEVAGGAKTRVSILSSGAWTFSAAQSWPTPNLDLALRALRPTIAAVAPVGALREVCVIDWDGRSSVSWHYSNDPAGQALGDADAHRRSRFLACVRQRWYAPVENVLECAVGVAFALPAGENQ